MTYYKELNNDELTRMAPAIAAEKPFHEVSSRYLFIPTLDVINLLRDAGWVPVFAEQAGVRKQERDGFQKHLIRFQHSGLEITNQERVDLVLYNSHDRGCAFNLLASVWRKVCGNGLMVASDLYNFSHKHIGFSPDDFLESAQTVINGASEIAYEVEDLKAIELTPNEKGVYALAAHHLIYDEPESAPIRPEQLLNEKRYDDKGHDLWSTFNVVQENVMKGGIRGFNRKTRKRTKTRPVKAIDRNVKLNKALWTLTEKMRELKS